MADRDAALAALRAIPDATPYTKFRPDALDRALAALAVALGATIPEAAAHLLRSDTRHRFYRRPAPGDEQRQIDAALRTLDAAGML